MRITKKTVAFLLILLVGLSGVTTLFLATDGIAADEIVLNAKVEKETVTAGESFDVTFSLNQAVKTQSFGLDFSEAYDQSAFTYVEGKWSSQILTHAALASSKVDGAVFLLNEELEVSGDIFTLTLKPTEAVKCGVPYEIKPLPGDRLNATPVGVTVTPDHFFDNDCDQICNSCQKKVRPAKHTYDDPRDTECNLCKLVRELPTYVYAVHRGDTVTVSVSLAEEIRVQGLGLDFLTAYDHEALEWVSGTWSNSVKSVALLAEINPGSEAAFGAPEESALSGEIFSFELKVKEDAEFGDYDVVVGIVGAGEAKLSTTVITVHQCAPSAEFSKDKNLHWNACTTYACQNRLNEGTHAFDGEEDAVCDTCGYTKYVLGDMDENGEVDLDDAIYLLYYINFPGKYPVSQSIDLDCNGVEDLDDAIYLLYHINFPGKYPLIAPATPVANKSGSWDANYLCGEELHQVSLSLKGEVIGISVGCGDPFSSLPSEAYEDFRQSDGYVVYEENEYYVGRGDGNDVASVAENGKTVSVTDTYGNTLVLNRKSEDQLEVVTTVADFADITTIPAGTVFTFHAE